MEALESLGRDLDLRKLAIIVCSLPWTRYAYLVSGINKRLLRSVDAGELCLNLLLSGELAYSEPVLADISIDHLNTPNDFGNTTLAANLCCKVAALQCQDAGWLDVVGSDERIRVQDGTNVGVLYSCQ